MNSILWGIFTSMSSEEFSCRIGKLADNTLLMISEIAKHSKEYFYQALKLVKSVDAEDEIVEKLKIMMKELNIQGESFNENEKIVTGNIGDINLY